MLHAQCRANAIDVEHPQHGVGIDIGHERGDFDARIVDDDVEAADLPDDFRNGGFPVLVLGHIQMDEAGPASLGRQFLGGRPADVILDIADHDIGTGRRQSRGYRCTDRLSPTGNERLPPFEIPHVSTRSTWTGYGRR